MTLFPIPVDENESEEMVFIKNRLYLLGLPAFITDIFGDDLRSYLDKRFQEILSALTGITPDNDFPLNSNSFVSRLKGSAIDARYIPCYKQEFDALIIQSAWNL